MDCLYVVSHCGCSKKLVGMHSLAKFDRSGPSPATASIIILQGGSARLRNVAQTLPGFWAADQDWAVWLVASLDEFQQRLCCIDGAFLQSNETQCMRHNFCQRRADDMKATLAAFVFFSSSPFDLSISADHRGPTVGGAKAISQSPSICVTTASSRFCVR
jgi:hypothetical protein